MQPASTAIELRPMRHDDIEAGLRLCRASRWNQTARDWARFLDADPSGTIVAVRDGRVIGSAATIRYGGEPGGRSRFAWIGMVLVEPEARGQGLGTALLSAAVASLGDVPARLDATPAGYPIYVKRGFVEESRLRRMQGAGTVTSRSAAADDIGTDAELRPMTAGDLPAVIAWDAEIFGAPRAEMLEWMYAGAPAYASIAIRDGRVAGYAFGRHGFTFEHLGPIVATDARLAGALTIDCLSRQQGQPAVAAGRELIIDASCHATEWMALLERIGFREQRPFIRMCRGGHPPFGEPERQFAIVGPEFG